MYLSRDFWFVYKTKLHFIGFFHFKTLKRMDVTSDKNLFDFIENLGKEENDLTEKTISTPPPLDSNQESEHVNVWDDIAEALNNWTERILHVESRYNNKVASFRQTIEESLRRQQLDGFLNHHDVT